jgi:hypothetical protein
MAADTASWNGDIRTAKAKKIRRLSDGSLFGAAGWLPVLNRVFEWLDAGADPEKKPVSAGASGSGDIDVIVVRMNGEIWRVHENCEFWKSDDDIATAGAHYEFLLGAMYAGAGACEAIELAIKHCRIAGGEVEWEPLILTRR